MRKDNILFPAYTCVWKRKGGPSWSFTYHWFPTQVTIIMWTIMIFCLPLVSHSGHHYNVSTPQLCDDRNRSQCAALLLFSCSNDFQIHYNIHTQCQVIVMTVIKIVVKIHSLCMMKKERDGEWDVHWSFKVGISSLVIS